jgi:ADP-heptose:LPS heptosyltransferase
MKFNPRQKIYVICETGALGDTVATFPILKILVERGHIEKLFVDDRYLDLYKLVFPSEIIVRMRDAITIVPREQITPDIPREVINPRTGDAQYLSYPLLPNIPVVHSMNQATLLPIHAHLVDSFSAAIANCILKENEKDYLYIDKNKLPPNPVKVPKYIVISYGSTTEHRKMLPEVFLELKEYFLAKGYDVVLLGKKDHELAVGGVALTHPKFDDIDAEGCIDLIDKTTLPESLAIMHEASLVLGVDGGLIHLAGMTDAPVVAGFTTVDPYYRVIYRHGKRSWKFYPVESDSDCRYCQTSTFATYGINFHICNTRLLDCMKSLTADKWIEQIKKALGE